MSVTDEIIFFKVPFVEEGNLDDLKAPDICVITILKKLKIPVFNSVCGNKTGEVIGYSKIITGEKQRRSFRNFDV